MARTRWACAVLAVFFALPYWVAPAVRLQCVLHGMATPQAAHCVAVHVRQLQRASITGDPQVQAPRHSQRVQRMRPTMLSVLAPNWSLEPPNASPPSPLRI